MEKVKEWILDNMSTSGTGSGYGDGTGYGYGDGTGSGSGFGFGYGYGDGTGSGYGDGTGYGYGDGTGSGYGFGYGSGDGHDNITSFNGKDVYKIDDIPTIIEQIRGPFARGFILNKDCTLTPCWIAKGNGYFAHGKNIKQARKELRRKIFENMDSDETIEKFIDKFKKNEKYPGTEFFEWHHYLTGSCLMGRNAFVKNHEIDIKAMYTVDEFIALCEDDYGGEIIKKLKEKWEMM